MDAAARSDGGVDAGAPRDAGPTDAGRPDAGRRDAGRLGSDAGPLDAGLLCDPLTHAGCEGLCCDGRCIATDLPLRCRPGVRGREPAVHRGGVRGLPRRQPVRRTTVPGGRVRRVRSARSRRLRRRGAHLRCGTVRTVPRRRGVQPVARRTHLRRGAVRPLRSAPSARLRWGHAGVRSRAPPLRGLHPSRGSVPVHRARLPLRPGRPAVRVRRPRPRRARLPMRRGGRGALRSGRAVRPRRRGVRGLTVPTSTTWRSTACRA